MPEENEIRLRKAERTIWCLKRERTQLIRKLNASITQEEAADFSNCICEEVSRVVTHKAQRAKLRSFVMDKFVTHFDVKADPFLPKRRRRLTHD